MNNNLLNISVSIADRPYRLKINKDEEAQVRSAAKMLNDKISEYQNSYHANDKQDYLAMAALLVTTDFLKLTNRMDKLKNIESQMLHQIENSLSQLEESAQI